MILICLNLCKLYDNLCDDINLICIKKTYNLHIFTHMFSNKKTYICIYWKYNLHIISQTITYVTYVSFMVGLCFTYLLFMYNLCKIYVSHMFFTGSYFQKIKFYDIYGSQTQHVFHKSNKVLFSKNKIL